LHLLYFSTMSTSQVVQSSPFSSLTILESEVKVLTFDPNNYGHVEACRGIPPEQLATMQTRENAITRIPWSKFNEKIKVAVFSPCDARLATE
jgi:predicted mannosyl-3-phosphoglycerate phosphatase (HAD superfamily)